MSPIGHLSISYLVGKTTKGICLWAILLGGVLPDIDFILLPFPFFNQVHRLVTHNFLFVGLSALSIGTWGAKRDKKYKAILSFSLFLGGLLHLFLDSCFDSNPSNGLGVALFWPFDDRYFSPFNLLQANESTVGWSQPVEMIRLSLSELMMELPFSLMAVVIWLKGRNFVR